MFTGIVRELGRVAEVSGHDAGVTLLIAAPATAGAAALGDSIAVAGVCLTAEAVEGGGLRFHAVRETLERTTLGNLAPGHVVNVEPALRAGEPLGGHIVQGHVDAVGTVRSVARDGEGARVVIEAPAQVLRYCVEKGSITVDGVSLTVASLDGGALSVALVPHTLDVTTLGRAAPGDRLNLEVDVLAKYVEKLVAPTLR